MRVHTQRDILAAGNAVAGRPFTGPEARVLFHVDHVAYLFGGSGICSCGWPGVGKEGVPYRDLLAHRAQAEQETT